jgi:zinc D-Ala-D-Ala carboxypeptidase
VRTKAAAAVGSILLSTLVFTAGNAAAAPSKPQGEFSAAAIRNCIDVANRDIGRGDTGNYVREVQCLLNWAVNPGTYHLISVDGEFGPDTEGKVKQFQRCAGGLAVDGRVGSQTAPKLEFWAASSSYVC